MDESAADHKIRKSNGLYITYEKSGGLYLVEPGLWQAGWLAGKIWVRLEILKACHRSKSFDFPLCLAKVLHCFSNFDAFLMLFQANTSTRLFYKV